MAIVHVISVNIVKLYLIIIIIYVTIVVPDYPTLDTCVCIHEMYFFPTVLDSDQESTLQSYVDPVSKFFEVGVLSSFLFYRSTSQSHRCTCMVLNQI